MPTVPAIPVRAARLALVALTACLTFALLVTAAPAREADPVSDYRERVAGARKLVERALAGDGPDELEAFTLATKLNELLPASETVDVNGTIVTVDNSVMRGMVARLASSPRANMRLEVIRELSVHLKSLHAATGVPGEEVPQDADALERLLAEGKPDGRSAISNLFGDIVDRLGRTIMNWWESVGASPTTGRTLTTITIVVLAMLTAFLLWVIARAFLASRAGAVTSPRGVVEVPVGPIVTAAEGLPDDPLAFAEEIAARGDVRGALRALFGGAARLLAGAGIVRQTRTHTNGELLAQVRSGDALTLHGPLASLCARFERAWYGHHEPDAGAFAEAREEYLAVRDAAR
ncbi:MAG: hypothetical protein CVT60_01810, partial [Actinobacteria bacterium HGW-Actinobacteria-10]